MRKSASAIQKEIARRLWVDIDQNSDLIASAQ
jgi:hypothetical protein